MKLNISFIPLVAFKDSHEIRRKVKAVQDHFTEFSHWYELPEIEKSHTIPLMVQNLQADPKLDEEWSNLFEELKDKATQTLAIIGLAMHNIIVSQQDEENREVYQHQKIYTR